jgi:hypothetical protein
MRYLILFLLMAAIVGCDGQPAPSAAQESKRTESAQAMRSIYDKVGGDYSKLTPEDKAAYLKNFKGNEQDGERMWTFMKSGSSTPPPQ